MKNNCSSVAVICPFFKAKGKSDCGQIIYCEGVEKNSSIHLAFAERSQRKDYMDNHCNEYEGHKECIIAKALYEKYEGV